MPFGSQEVRPLLAANEAFHMWLRCGRAAVLILGEERGSLISKTL